MFKNTFHLSLLRLSAKHDRMLCTMPPASVCRFILINSKDAGENSEPRPWITFTKSGLPSIETYSTFLQKTDVEIWGSLETQREKPGSSVLWTCKVFLPCKQTPRWRSKVGQFNRLSHTAAICKYILKLPLFDNYKWEINFSRFHKNYGMYSKLR